MNGPDECQSPRKDAAGKPAREFDPDSVWIEDYSKRGGFRVCVHVYCSLFLLSGCFCLTVASVCTPFRADSLL